MILERRWLFGGDHFVICQGDGLGIVETQNLGSPIYVAHVLVLRLLRPKSCRIWVMVLSDRLRVDRTYRSYVARNLKGRNAASSKPELETQMWKVGMLCDRCGYDQYSDLVQLPI